MASSPDKKTAPPVTVRSIGSRARAFGLLVLAVIVVHAVVLKGLAQALSSVQPAASTGLVFTARTLQPDAPQQPPAPRMVPDLAPPAVPLQTKRPTQAQALPPPAHAVTTQAPEKPLPAAAAPMPTSIPQAPEPAQEPTAVLAQRAVEPQPSAPAGAASPNANPMPSGGAVRVNAGLPDYDYTVPGSVRLKYKGSGTKGFLALPVSAELMWARDGKAYDARLELGLLGFSRVQTSKGAVGPRGLEPLRFGDKTRSEEAAHFQRAKGIVSFSGNGPDAPLMPLAQDLLSVYVQLASMWGANSARFSPGMQLPFQLVEKHRAGNRVFTVGATERLKVESREMVAIRLVCDPSAEYDNRVEVWLAPALEYLPARIRMTQANGDEVDIFWSSTEKP